MSIVISIIIPANNEARYIGQCLAALLDSDPVPGHALELIVVANGCTDDTVKVARRYEMPARERGWVLKVQELKEGSKIKALNAGDVAAIGRYRVYLDADVRVSRPLLGQLVDVLDRSTALYATGTPHIAPPESRLTRLYARFWQSVPFNRSHAPGYGLFAVNAAGRARWGKFPHVIADDTFVRLQFSPDERVQVPASYTWPMVEGVMRLVRVRRRQDQGTAEIAARFPELMQNEGKERPDILALAKADPTGFAVYAFVALMVRAGKPLAGKEWSRGR
ncbi:MAG: glycosyltransferase family 2 protein [Rhodobacteraceae bacterium]|nr:glycosyltransferase family 2 protein [Paracoccaceae bacterium]